VCGIAAIHRYGAGGVIDPAELHRVTECMACRGPDGSGEWTSEDHRAALGHRRLSIIDLSALGNQPMATPAGDIVIAFNGEIYNYRDLRRSLEARGSRFISGSDTEVLLHLYRERGTSMFAELRGMYAIALWDARKHRLLLARDPFGIKPLYISDDGKTVRAASEVKALLRSGAIDRAPDPAGHVGFFLWGHVPEPHTMYRNIRPIAPGTVEWFGKESGREQFASIREIVQDAESSARAVDVANAADRVVTAFEDSVKHHLVADVDVGVFLSAGLDSTAIASLAARHTTRLSTVTLGFAEFKGTPNDETVVAEQVARHLGTNHRTIWVSQADFQAERDRFLARMDQPTTDGLNSYFVARAAAEAGVKVAMSGLGGDELLAGYPSYTQVPRLARLGGLLPAGRQLGRRLRPLLSALVSRVSSPKYAGVLEYGTTMGDAYFLRRAVYMPWELERVLDPEMVRAGLDALALRDSLARSHAGIREPRFQMTALEATWFMRNQLLRDVDWASMSHSIEVRVPFLDVTLWRAVLPLAANRANVDRRIIARALAHTLPAAVLTRPKSGFFIPTREWLVGSEGREYEARRLRGWARYVYERAELGIVLRQPSSLPAAT
jgi:asparagine synthase (glutamine-hydrolysing)